MQAFNQDEEKQPGVGELKRGDYIIHVFVERGKDFKSDEDFIDPIIEVSSLGQKKYTTAKKNITALDEVQWSEHVFLEPRNIEKLEAEEGKIIIKLLDKGFYKNYMIGTFEFDISYIYLRKDHTMLHQWVALSNPNSEDYSQITGYLKLSISVACTGDDQVEIKEDPGSGENDDNVLMPPQLNPKFYQLKFRFFQAQDIAPMDREIKILNRRAKTDAFMMCVAKKRKLKTDVIVMEEGGKPINWNQEFWIPAQIPLIQSRIVIKMMDEDNTCDEVVGSIHFDIKEIIERFKNKQAPIFEWKNIYGSPLEGAMDIFNSQVKDEMNDNPEVASFWKGRVLIQVTCEETENPELKVEKIDKEVVEDARAFLRMKSYDFIAEIGQAVALPTDNKYKIKMMIGGKSFVTNEPSYHSSRYCRYNHRFEQQTITGSYSDVSDFGDLIILLMDEDNRPVCYYKDRIENYTKPEADYKWIQFKPDLCVGRVTNANEAGMLSFKFSIHDVSKNQYIDFSDYQSWNVQQNKGQAVKIRAYIYQCRDLPAADSNGTSDPFVRIWDMTNEVKQTKVCYENNNPLFFEVKELTYEVRNINDLSTYPPIIVEIFDRDENFIVRDTNDYIGRAVIKPSEASIRLQKDFEKCTAHGEKSCVFCQEERTNKEIPTTPKWHSIRYTEGEPETGAILISFTVTSRDYIYQFEPEALDLRQKVPFQKFEVNMLILGLRELQSPGILPVKKAFIQFNLKSLVPPNSSAVQNIQTQPSAPGSNPTINTIMKFQIPLPTNHLYCPKLSCAVYDYIFKGLNQPNIGVFTVDIGKIMKELREEREREIEIMEAIISELRKICGIEHDEDFVPINNYGINNASIHSFEIEEFESKESKGNKSMIKSTFKNMKSKRDDKARINRAFKDSVNEADFKEEFGAKETDGIRHAIDTKNEQYDRVLQEKGTLQRISTQRRYSNVMIGRSKSIRVPIADKKKNTFSNKVYEQLFNQKQEEELRREEDLRQEELAELNKEGELASKIIIMPKYQMDTRLKVLKEVNPPPSKLFIALGFDEDKDMKRYDPEESDIIPRKFQKRKHYRQFYNTELENVREIFNRKSPFNTIEIKRGQSRGISKGGLLSFFQTQKQDASGQVSTERCVGFFKGIIEIENAEEKQRNIDHKDQLLSELISLIKLVANNEGIDIEIDFDMLRNPASPNLNRSSSNSSTGGDLDKEGLLNIRKSTSVKGVRIDDAIGRKAFERKLIQMNLGHLNISKHLAHFEQDEILKRLLLAKAKCCIRLYMISAHNLSQRDNDSPSDPYLYITCNNKIYNERDNYQLDEENPKFHKRFDFEGYFPGSSPIRIEVYDWDEIFGDDLIGTTIIDLEDRYFSMEWQALEEKPVEFRKIYHDSSTISQGMIKCWVEINQTSLKEDEYTVWDITEQPPEEFEVRVCVFNCEGIPMMDAEGTSDVFFKGFFDATKDKDLQETDTHYRNQNGCPDFQYRLVYRVLFSRNDQDNREQNTKFTLQCLDRDLFKENDLIGQASLNLRKLIEDCSYVKKHMVLNQKFHERVLKPLKIHLNFDKSDPNKFWLPLEYKNPKNGGKIEVNGKVKVQIDVVPKDVAEKNPVGKAREEPNHSPYLSQPEGRLTMTYNPIKMYQQLVGPSVRRKICVFICCIALIALVLLLSPSILIGILAHFGI